MNGVFTVWLDEINNSINGYDLEIEKNINQVMKLAKWTINNIETMKESCKRYHYQLKKYMTDYKKNISDVFNKYQWQRVVFNTNIIQNISYVKDINSAKDINSISIISYCLDIINNFSINFLNNKLIKDGYPIQELLNKNFSINISK